MTKARDALTPFLALTRAAGTIGWQACADLAKRAVRTIQNWSDPDTSAGISLEAALKIDIACMEAGQPPHFFRWFGQRLDLADAEHRQSRANIAVSAAIAAKEIGEAQAATLRAVTPGAGQSELLIAERETAEAVEALSHTLHDIRAAAHGQRSDD